MALGNLAAGAHSLAIGALNNKGTWSNESTKLIIDDLAIVAEAPAAEGSGSTLNGTAGDDIMFGGADDDSLSGMAGSDTLDGG